LKSLNLKAFNIIITAAGAVKAKEMEFSDALSHYFCSMFVKVTD
jgi:hypothetical protein